MYFSIQVKWYQKKFCQNLISDKSDTEQTFKYKKANYEEITETLKKINWDSILDDKYDLDIMFDSFTPNYLK